MGLKDLLGRKLEQKTKGVFKDMMMKAVKAYLIKIAIIVAIVAVVIVFLASTFLNINETIVTKTSETIRNNGNTSSVTVNSNSREYNLDTEFSKRVSDALKNLAIDPESKGLTEELIIKMYEAEIFTSYPDLRERNKIGTKITGDGLQGCIQFRRKYSDGTEETLEYMEFDKFRIEVAKFGYDLQDADGNSVSQEQIYFSKDEVNAKYKELRRYFTLDEECNVIIATLNSNEVITTYSDYAKEEENQDSQSYDYYLDIVKANYRTSVGQYAMPLEFTLSILAVTENPGFCEAILDLVKDSKIVIEVQDCLSTTNIVEKYDYIGNFEFEKKIEYYTMELQEVEEEEEEGETEDGNENSSSSVPEQLMPDLPDVEYEAPDSTDFTPVLPNEDYQVPVDPDLMPDLPKYEWVKVEDDINLTGTYTKQKDMNNPYKEVETIIENTIISFPVVEAKTWFADVTVTYQKNTQPLGAKESSTNIPDDTEYVEVEDYHDLLETLDENLPIGATETSREEIVKEKQTNKELKVETTGNDVTYSKISTQIYEREERFLSLLAVNPLTGEFDKTNIAKNTKLIKYKDAEGRKTSPEGSLLTSTQMLFELLGSSQESQDSEEKMRYLLYIYTGKSYGVTTFDFSIYEPTSFNAVTFTSSLNKFKEYLHAWEGCTSLSADGTMYKIEEDGGGNPTVGYGIDINANKQTIEAAGYSTNTGDYIPKDFIDALEDEIITRNIETVEAKTAGLNLTQYQIYALVSRTYNCGESGAFGVRNGKTFIQAYNAYWNQEIDGEYKVEANANMYEHSLYTEYMCKPTTSKGQELSGLVARRKSEWILFKTGYFDRINEYCSELAGSAGAILESAEAIHYYMEQNSYSYCLLGGESNLHAGECGLDTTFEQSKSNHQLTCCATYVSWVLREAGYIDVTYHSSSNLASYLISQGFTQVSYSEMQAGDIVFMRTDDKDIGHTQIYAGDGQWYNAGSNQAIRRSSPYKSTVSSNKIVYVLRAP